MRVISRVFIMFLSALLVVGLGVRAEAAPAAKTLQVKTSGGVKKVTAVYVNLNDRSIRLMPVLAADRIKKTESLESMAKRKGALAAINGTFFNSYSDMQPQGTLKINGEFQHLAAGTFMGITGDNRVVFQRCEWRLEGTIDGPSKVGLPPWEAYQCNWYAWALNRVNPDPGAIIVFTPSWGSTVDMPQGTNVVVSAGKVMSIVAGKATIPHDGFVIHLGPAPASQKYVSRFVPGDSVAYKVRILERSGAELDWSSYVHIIGVGPLLVKEGRVCLDFSQERFADPKILKNSGARSFIGVTADNQLVMAAVPAATVAQLAEIAAKMGLKEAMNMDGGASSGLYFNGKYLTRPGRLLSNCLAVVPAG